jgi:hypothetical protein
LQSTEYTALTSSASCSEWRRISWSTHFCTSRRRIGHGCKSGSGFTLCSHCSALHCAPPKAQPSSPPECPQDFGAFGLPANLRAIHPVDPLRDALWT